MAISKIIGAIHPPKSGGRYKVLKNVINYVLNPKKTNDGRYTGSVNCSTLSALQEMIFTKEHYNNTSSSQRERLGYHYVISWSKDEFVDPDIGFKIIEEFCKSYFRDEYEAVYSLHNDKEHSHGHIAFNSVNCKTGKKFRYNDGDWAKIIQPTVDDLCKKYGLHTLSMDTGFELEEYDKKYISHKKNNHVSERAKENKGKSYSNNKYYNEHTSEYTQSDYIRAIIDKIIPFCDSFDDLLSKLKNNDFEIKRGKHIAVKGKGMERYRRLYSLGSDYSEQALISRINIRNEPIPKYPDIPNTQYCLPDAYRIQVKKTFSIYEKRYYARVYKLNICSKNKYPNYREITNRIKDIKAIEKKLELLNQFNIVDATSANNTIEIYNKKLLDINNRKNDYNQKKRTYKDIFTIYREMEDIKHRLYSYGNDYAAYKKDQDRYNELSSFLNQYEIKYDEIPILIDNIKNEYKVIQKDKRTVLNEIKMLNSIKTDLLVNEPELNEDNIRHSRNVRI